MITTQRIWGGSPYQDTYRPPSFPGNMLVIEFWKAVFTRATSLCYCLLPVGILSIWLNESGWVFCWELPSTYPTMHQKEIRVFPKIKALPSGTLSQTLDFENFASLYRLSLTYSVGGRLQRNNSQIPLDGPDQTLSEARVTHTGCVCVGVRLCVCLYVVCVLRCYVCMPVICC